MGSAMLSAVFPTMTTIKLVHSTARIFHRRASTSGSMSICAMSEPGCCVSLIGTSLARTLRDRIGAFHRLQPHSTAIDMRHTDAM